MTPHFADDHLTVHVGDCREVLATLPAESVHCVVTSPPYWGLRDYGTATWEGGEEGCDHRGSVVGGRGSSSKSTLTTGSRNGAWAPGTTEEVTAGDCKCGARRIDAQLGLEATPEEYVANMVAVFREVRRVLRSDGTVWLNIGDSYATGAGSVGDRPGGGRQGDNWKGAMTSPNRMPLPGLKPKDLVGIPWRLAFALQADGWYLRSDVIWSKPNPMPESVTDRPTKAHEYVFLLSKSARYFYDADAVREEQAETSIAAYERARISPRQPADWKQNQAVAHIGAGPTVSPNAAWSDPEKLDRLLSRGRNLRTVWTIATQPYPGAHFATFPEKLVEPCIKAGTSERGVCPECGAPWVREVEREVSIPQRQNYHGEGIVPVHRGGGGRAGGYYPSGETVGWRPSCAHDAEPVPATVLDPFGGSGTTARVANRLGRRAILIDLSADYIDQAMARNAQAPLGLVG